jgi:hypothetical protein
LVQRHLFETAVHTDELVLGEIPEKYREALLQTKRRVGSLDFDGWADVEQMMLIGS